MSKMYDKIKNRSKTYVRIGMISASLLLAAVPANVQADVASGMDMMWTSTAPEMGAVNNNYGGTLGGISMRSPVRSFNILAYDPPRFSAGCGGIDAYFGSFSMISADNMRNIIRSIMSNATGYALKIALDNMCSSCQNIMSGLQDMTAKINSASKNTCQIASTMIESARGNAQLSDIYGDTLASYESVVASAKGIMSDFSEANNKRTYAGQNANRAADAADTSTVYGNNLMNTLASAGVFGQGGNAKIDTAAYGGDQSFLQIAMNLYGTGINLTGANAESSVSGGTYTKGSTQRKDKVIEPIWRFDDLVNGKPDNQSLNGYVCSDFNLNTPASCQNVKTDEASYPGTKRYMIRMLAGEQTALNGGIAMGDAAITKITDDSIMAHLADNTIVLSPERARFLNALPRETVALLSQAATASDNTTKAAVSYAAEILAGQMAAELVRAMNTTLSIAYSANTTAGGKDVVPMSDGQRAQMMALEKAAEAHLSTDARAQAQRNMNSLIGGAVLLSKGLAAVH